MIRAVVALAVLLPGAGLADADGPDAFRVTGVAVGDTLNMRIGPGVDYAIAGTLPHDARHLPWEVCVPTVTDGQYFAMTDAEQAALKALPRWCLVHPEGVPRAWVNARFLSEDVQAD